MAKKYDLRATAVFTALAIPPVALVSFGASSGMDAALSAFNVNVDYSILFAGVFGVMMLAVGSKINDFLAMEKDGDSAQQSQLDDGYQPVSSSDSSLHSNAKKADVTTGASVSKTIDSKMEPMQIGSNPG